MGLRMLDGLTFGWLVETRFSPAFCLIRNDLETANHIIIFECPIAVLLWGLLRNARLGFPATLESFMLTSLGLLELRIAGV